ncbi:MAG: DNA-protecting protein DprA [Planctomycetes bacterium]|nr:DNA-protecting protein DprA [Planctomycetota bacterium]
MERPKLHLTAASARWPAALRGIESPPEQLWLRGAADILAREPKVAIVGARAPTPYGEAQARRFASALACAGVVVVSGMARGVDQCAHDAALDAGGATIGVLGCGVDRPWPAGPCAERLLREGLLLSEFEPGAPPLRRNFPLRNRVISGLCAAVVVIEAAEASGSLITARWAADQGRAVFALPGRVDHPMARGCHRLIREGASLVQDPDDVLEELGLAAPRKRSDAGRAEGDGASADLASASVLARRAFEALLGETLSADELAERLAADVAEVLTELVELELRGAVVRGAGGLYRRS